MAEYWIDNQDLRDEDCFNSFTKESYKKTENKRHNRTITQLQEEDRVSKVNQSSSNKIVKSTEENKKMEKTKNAVTNAITHGA